MATNDFIGFASNGSANVMSQADYAAAAEQGDGVQPGPASSALANKVWRQGANMAAALGEIIKAQGIDALDNGDIATLSNNIVSALSAFLLSLSGGTMTGTIAKSSGHVIKSTGTNNYLAILGGTGGTATEGAQIIVHGPDHAESGAFILHAGNSTGFKRLIGKPDGTLTWDGYQLSPIAKSASGVGEWTRLFANASSIALPSGGTWAYFAVGVDSTNDIKNVQSSVAAGGTTIMNQGTIVRIYGFCWRVA